MTPVATYCRWKNALSACWEIPFGAACLAIAVGLVPYFVAVEVVGRQHGSWMLLLLGLMPLLFAWLSLKDGVDCARAALDKEGGWLHAGPEGISYRLPPGGKRSIAWSEVVQWYPQVTRVNGIQTGSRLVIKTHAGGVYHLEGKNFRESIPDIIGNIQNARVSRPVKL